MLIKSVYLIIGVLNILIFTNTRYITNLASGIIFIAASIIYNRNGNDKSGLIPTLIFLFNSL